MRRQLRLYWTPERMANATPMPTPMATVDSLSLALPLVSEESGEPAVPGYAPGCRPNASNSIPHRAHYLLETRFLLRAVLMAICFNRCMALNPPTPEPAPTAVSALERGQSNYRLPQIDYWKIILHTQ